MTMTDQKVKLVVLGAGATGGFFGAMAARGGMDVTFVARGAHGAAMRERGLRIRSTLQGEWTVSPRVVGYVGELDDETFDLVLVTVKSPDLEAILPAAARLAGDRGIVVTAQNGVECEEQAMRHLPAARVVGAALIISVGIAEPGVLDHRGMALALVGAPRPESETSSRRVAEWLGKAGVQVSHAPDLAAARWSKLVWNNAWNALTAITRLPVGIAAKNPSLRELATRAMREVEAVGRALGVKMPDNIIDTCLIQTDALGDVRPSMLQDVEAGRVLEHEALVGVIVRRGRELGVPTPVNDVLYPILAALSARARV
jgi:2-dehydropantoate 2-reductase